MSSLLVFFKPVARDSGRLLLFIEQAGQASLMPGGGVLVDHALVRGAVKQLVDLIKLGLRFFNGAVKNEFAVIADRRAKVLLPPPVVSLPPGVLPDSLFGAE